MYISGPAAGTALGISYPSHISNTEWIRISLQPNPLSHFSVRFLSLAETGDVALEVVRSAAKTSETIGASHGAVLMDGRLRCLSRSRLVLKLLSQPFSSQ